MLVLKILTFKTCSPRRSSGPFRPSPFGLIISGMEGESFYALGRNAVLELLRSRPLSVQKVWVGRELQGPAFEELRRLCREAGVPLVRADKAFFSQLERRGEVHHQGVVALVCPWGLKDPSWLVQAISQKDRGLLAILDHLEDPQNLGAVGRSLLAFGGFALVVPSRRGSPITPSALRASAGALAHLEVVRVGSLLSLVEGLKSSVPSLWVYGLDVDGELVLGSFDLPPRCAFVVGSEGRGLSRSLKRACDGLVRIPISTVGSVSSLNASVAAALAFYEWHKLHGR